MNIQGFDMLLAFLKLGLRFLLIAQRLHGMLILISKLILELFRTVAANKDQRQDDANDYQSQNHSDDKSVCSIHKNSFLFKTTI